LRLQAPSPRRPALGRSPVEVVNQRQDEVELAPVHQSVKRAGPFGQESWIKQMVRALGLEATQRSRGRPRKRAQ
jgi:hypothetical protein